MTSRHSLPRPIRLAFLLAIISATASLGCGVAGIPHTQTSASANTIAGNVHGGQQPVAFGSIKLWAVGTTGDASASQSLLTNPVTTDAYGNFSLTNDFTCPTPTTLVYLTATGGSPGLSGGAVNNNLALMAALGACGSLNASTFITINEVTTIGAAMALHPYMLSFSTVGSGSSDASALTTAFATASEFVNVAAGAAGGSNIPSGSTVDTTLINTLANLLAVCVNSPGGISGDGSICGNLFALTGGASTTDTVASALYIANNPNANVSALFNLLTPSGPFQPVYTTAPASFAVAINTGSQASNYYAIQGQQFLTQLHNAFIQTAPPKNGFNLPLYASDINPLNGTQLVGNAQLFAQENLIRAFYWGAQVFPSQFKPLLSNAVNQLDWNNYLSAYGQCFGTTANATCFFDDDAQLGGTLMDVYLHVLPTTQLYTDSTTASAYVLSNVDAQGGIPQTPSKLGMGNYYMSPVVETGAANVNYGTIFSNSADVTLGLNYFNQVNNPALGLLNKAGLFIGGTNYNGDGTWTANKVGPLPGESVNVSLLAIALYRNTGDSQYLQYAENLTNLVVTKWVDVNGGVSANAVNGGYGIVNLLCQLYVADHNITYFNTAQRIIDFLLTNNRDTAGYFSNGTTNAGNLNIVRTGLPPDADTVLLTQGATAAALLEFAYTDLNYPPTPGVANLQTTAVVTNTGSNYSETLTVTNTGTAVAPTVLITSATLGGAAGSTVPALLGDLLPNQSASVTLTFPTSAGTSNASVSEVVSGTYIGGTLNSTFLTTLP